jgi:hypothetical protein
MVLLYSLAIKRLITAALMNWGRAPTIVTIFIILSSEYAMIAQKLVILTRNIKVQRPNILN